MDTFKKLVELHGHQVPMDEPQCLIWKAEHENCKGCPSHLACGKMVKLQLVTISMYLYQPRSFQDRLDELFSRVIEAKTYEELASIPLV